MDGDVVSVKLVDEELFLPFFSLFAAAECLWTLDSAPPSSIDKPQSTL